MGPDYAQTGHQVANGRAALVMRITLNSLPEREVWFCKMSFATCCSDLEKLVAKPDKEKGLGLLCVINKLGTRFILEYRRDWKVPIADAAIQIAYCPYCGSKLQLVT
jgi:hypothetical protein